MKKIISIILLVFLFAACAQNGESSANTDRETQSVSETTSETSYYEILGERNFNGYTFTIIDANDYPGTVINFPEEDGMTGEPINDALYIRDKFIEDKYGVTLKYIQMTNANNGCLTLEKSVLADEQEYDLIVSTLLGNSLDRLSTRNVLYNLIDAPYLSLTSPWWSKLMYDNITFNNRLYYSGGDIFLPSYTNSPGIMLVNKKLLYDHGVQENLYQLVFDGKWTLEVLERISKDRDMDLNGDGKMMSEDDFYGLLYQHNALTMGIFFAGIGGKYSENMGDTIAVNLTSKVNIDKIDRLTDLLKEYKYKDQNNIINITFKEDRALFLMHCMESPQVFLRDMESDYGILPMPKWDEKQDTYISFLNAWTSGSVGIPQNVDIERTAFIVEAMAYAGYKTLREPVYEISFKTKGSRDTESERMIDIIFETVYMDLNGIYNFGNSYDIVCDAVIYKKPFMSSYEARATSIEKAIDDFIKVISNEN